MIEVVGQKDLEINIVIVINNKEYTYPENSPQLNNLLLYLETNSFITAKYSLLIRKKGATEQIIRTAIKDLTLPLKIDIKAALLEEPNIENPNFDKYITYNYSTKKFELLPTESFLLRLECYPEGLGVIKLIYIFKKDQLHNQIYIPSHYVDKKILRIEKFVSYQNRHYRFDNTAYTPYTPYTPIKSIVQKSETTIQNVLFCFFNQIIIEHINRSKKSILCCIYNIENNTIIDAIISAKKRGVDINILTSYKCLESKHYSQQSSYYKLLENNIQISVIIHAMDNENIHSSMHTKFAVFDSLDILTGSVNWENLSCTTNEEQLLHIRSTEIAYQYEQMYRMFCTGDTKEYEMILSNLGTATLAPINTGVSTVPPAVPAVRKIVLHETLYTKSKCLKDMYDCINELSDCDCYISMFIFMKFCGDYSYNIFDLLREKAERENVRLNIIVEENTNSASYGLYYQHKIPSNKYLDEVETWKNVNLYRLKTYKGNNPYSAIHHKFFATEKFVICGSANWWDISFTSEDDILIIRDEEVSKKFIKAWHDLINPFFTLNNLPFCKEKPKSLYVEMIDPPYKPVLMNYSDLMNEYYVSIPIIPNRNIVYRYYYEEEKELTFENLIRTKSPLFYKETDHWSKESQFDMMINKINVV